MKVLYAVSECTPFVQTGGLADVAGALPQALNKVGCDVRVVLPKYGIIKDQYKGKFKKVADFFVRLNHEAIYCGVEQFKYDNVTYYFIDNETFFKRNQIYGFNDEGARFAYFSKAVLEMISHIKFQPDILHINDWHCGLLPLLYKEHYQQKYPDLKIILTIHNLKYQGSFDRMILDYCMLPQSTFDQGTTNHDGLVNYLKTAIVLSDCVTTVSPSYANEIKTPFYGEGLHDILSHQEIVGILNGIDTDFYNPKKDDLIKARYDSNRIGRKKHNKKFLQKYYSLSEKDVPVVAVLSRLVKHKGIGLVIKAFEELMHLDFQFVLLGCGDEYYSRFFESMQRKYPEKVRISIEFNPVLARFLYAGADFLLMPSIFEPCGLTQMIAMRYGTIPIVRETGGLKDSVQCFNTQTLSGTGFGFKTLNEKDMINVLKYVFEIYHNKKWMHTLRENAMNEDFSWKQSALSYKELYQSLIK